MFPALLTWWPARPQSRSGEDLKGRRSMKCLLGKLRTRVSVFSDGGMLGGQAIDTLIDTWAVMWANWADRRLKSLSIGKHKMKFEDNRSYSS